MKNRGKIFFIPGIFNPKRYQEKWKEECEGLGFQFIEFGDPLYSYWNIKKMRKLVSEGTKIFEKNRDLIVICHSFGGILFNRILQKVKKPSIKKAIFIASPLKMNVLGMWKRKKILGFDRNIKYNFDYISFGGYFDELVPFFFTKYRDEKHYNFFVEHHLFFLFSRKTIRKILRLSGIK